MCFVLVYLSGLRKYTKELARKKVNKRMKRLVSKEKRKANVDNGDGLGIKFVLHAACLLPAE